MNDFEQKIKDSIDNADDKTIETEYFKGEFNYEGIPLRILTYSQSVGYYYIETFFFGEQYNGLGILIGQPLIYSEIEVIKI